MKTKTLDELIIELNGQLPEPLKCPANDGDIFLANKNVCVCNFESNRGWVVGSAEQFQQRAKELGFVGRYRWGVEYPTDGKRPELDGDVVVSVKWDGSDWRKGSEAVGYFGFENYSAFKITDQRYKPADTSYLDKVDGSLDNGADWYCYETKKALRLPPVGVECEYLGNSKKWDKCKAIFNSDYVIVIEGKAVLSELVQVAFNYGDWPEFRPTDHDRKAKAERKRVVDAAAAKFHASIMPDYSGQPFIDGLSALYDAGFLRLPD